MIAPRGAGSSLRVRVVPSAGRSGIVGEHGGALKVRVCSPPVDGRANDEVCAVVADALGIPARDVSVVTGPSSRSKVLAVDLPPDTLALRLQPWLGDR